MRRVSLALFIVLAASGKDAETLTRDLDNIARIATVMIDGDVCQRIVTPRALEYMLKNPSLDKWADADNYDVDDASFMVTKKTLIRLSKLVDYPVDVNLWMPLKADLSARAYRYSEQE